MNPSSYISPGSLNATHLLVVAGDAAEVAVELVSTVSYTLLSFLLVAGRSQRSIFDVRYLLQR